MVNNLSPSDTIRSTLTRITRLRQTAAENPELSQAVSAIKQFQARRFAGTYTDLLQSKPYRSAALFFLEELYGEKDYSERDSQFARVAGALERIFPRQAVQAAVSLAQLHLLTEEFDLAMAQIWVANMDKNEVARYIAAWRAVDRRSDRSIQIATVLNIGQELDELTRITGLRLMLKMMRGPANVAGLRSLQRFIEAGFDTFAAMGKQGQGAAHFIETVRARESGLVDRLFDAPVLDCEKELTQILGQVW